MIVVLYSSTILTNNYNTITTKTVTNTQTVEVKKYTSNKLITFNIDVYKSVEPTITSEPITTTEQIEQSKLYCVMPTSNERYLLAKIAMAEAESESIEAKQLVIMVVLNRTLSGRFDTDIESVIFAKNQFTPTTDGRWNRIEPNEDCYTALNNVLCMTEDKSNGALYFESCNGSSWHSRNLQLVKESGKLRFYK